ncbi:gamma-glutamylcyclotransferase family protein [Streptomyces sp. NPDC059517]|uniref:gamma-glutamylcyclotransferase family protein n=1 Tax=Streptomyces sp. NPDC059517 TaxID=3346855 RepID=UPI0036C8AE35
MNRLPFFVYGTLLRGEANHDAFLRGRTLSETPATLTGALLYEGPGYPYAVETPEAHGGVVHGELVTADPAAYPQLLAALDELEEYAPGDPAHLYERVARDVTRTSDAARVRAWVYVAAPTVAAELRASGQLIKGGDWRPR